MATDRAVVGNGFQIIFRGGTVQKKIQEAVVEGLTTAGKIYLEAVKNAVSLDDHTLAELKQLGHPYAKNTSVPPVHEDDRLVHIQSGELIEGIKLSHAIAETGRRFSIYVTSDAEYTDFLLLGTSFMRPRRFDEKAWEDVGGDSLFDTVKKKLYGINYRIER